MLSFSVVEFVESWAAPLITVELVCSDVAAVSRSGLHVIFFNFALCVDACTLPDTSVVSVHITLFV